MPIVVRYYAVQVMVVFHNQYIVYKVLFGDRIVALIITLNFASLLNLGYSFKKLILVKVYVIFSGPIFCSYGNSNNFIGRSFNHFKNVGSDNIKV